MSEFKQGLFLPATLMEAYTSGKLNSTEMILLTVLLEKNQHADPQQGTAISNKELGRIMAVKEDTISSMVRSLVKRGWITRGEFDGRIRYLIPHSTPQDTMPSFGFVYFLECMGMYKIGISKQEDRGRLNQYDTSNPFPKNVLFFEEVWNYKNVEQKIIKQFAQKVYKGNEWFKLEEKDVGRIIRYLNKKVEETKSKRAAKKESRSK